MADFWPCAYAFSGKVRKCGFGEYVVYQAKPRS